MFRTGPKVIGSCQRGPELPTLAERFIGLLVLVLSVTTVLIARVIAFYLKIVVPLG